MGEKSILPVRGTSVELTQHIIAEMNPGNELSDAGCPRSSRALQWLWRFIFYRYRLTGGALRQVKLGEFGPLTLRATRVELTKRRLERERGFDPQREKLASAVLIERNAHRDSPRCAGQSLRCLKVA